MYLWIDDVRPSPDDNMWTVARTSEEALTVLRNIYGELVGASGYGTEDTEFVVCSFDHDLGGDDTTRPVMEWMVEYGIWPAAIQVHSANIVGRQWLLGMADMYAPDWVRIPQITYRLGT